MTFNRYIYFLVLAVWMLGCGGERSAENRQTESRVSFNQKVQSEYAQSFRVNYHDNFKEVIVSNAWKGSDLSFRYLLVPEGVEIPEAEDATIIRIPVKKMVCFSTTHIPLLDYLGVTDKLVGFPNTDYISSPKARFLIDQGEVADIGTTEDINMEVLLDLDPDLVMTFAMENEERFELIRRAGIPVVFNADYMENTPLGRAEWIKFMALFFNLEHKADSIFGGIAHAYDTLQQLSAQVEEEPTVFSGIVYGDTWFMPGGENYAAKFFDDARARYLWKNNDEKSYLELSFESVYDQAADASYWVGVGTYDSREELLKADSRYQQFKAFREDRVYNYNARMGATGGNEYFELGYLRPDLVLADLVKIFHPNLLPDYSMYFHKKLN